jgi:hypothetical protein
MKAPNLIATAVSTLLVGATLFALRSADIEFPAHAQPLASVIDGIPVTQFNMIVVRPTAAQLGATGSSIRSPGATALARDARDQALGLIGSQLAMPYYSFGTALRPAGKE